MKKSGIGWLVLAAVCMVVLLGLCLARIVGLEKRLDQLESNLESAIQSVNWQVESLGSQITSANAESQNLLAESGWEYGEMNREEATVEVELHLTLKECDPTTTQVTLNCNDTPRLMRWDGSRFVTGFAVPLMEETHITTVLMEDGGVLRTQELDWYLCPREEMLLQVTGIFEGSGTVEDKGSTWLDQRHGPVIITTDVKDGNRRVTGIDLVWMADDQELSRKAVDMSYEGQEKAAEGTGFAINADRSAYEQGNAGQYYARIEENREYAKSKSLWLYAVVTDDLGLQYWTLCDAATLEEDGETMTQAVGDTVRIVSADGKVLWE